jgi:glycosyltransferase involved in cell wall biosynthesis
MATPPRVTCVMPTRDCRLRAAQAIWYFLRQDYGPRELVIVDDGDDCVADQIPIDPRIRHLRLEQRLSSAAKRNLCCELSTGDLVAHWDDTAWYSPHRLAAQVEQINHAGADVAALGGLLHYQPLTGRLWRYEGRPGTTAGLRGVGLVYRRSYWDANRFADDGRDEVDEFIRRVPPARLDVEDGAGLVVAILQGSGTSPVNPADMRWQPQAFDELRLMQQDLRFYTDRPASGWPTLRRQTPAPITLAATFVVYDGYGSMAEYLALGMVRSGADVNVAPFHIDTVGLSTEFHALAQRSRPDPAGIVLCHAWWGENLARFGSTRDLFVKTAWETSRLPADWPARLDRTAAVMVPSRFAARVFRNSGVRAPVEVVHEGVDPEVYPYEARPEREGLTTLVVGVLAPRKNFREGVAAWKLAFADDPDARLILKARFQLETYVPDDPRIRVVDSNEPTRGISHWYRQADVLLALGNEGFGLPLIEGMASGLPAVALAAEAQRDICEEAVGMVLPVRPAKWEPVNDYPYGACGVRAIPDVEDAARQLRWVAEHRREAREIGRRASSWAHAHRNVWDMGPATLTVIERYARTSRPLRRSHAMWAPLRHAPAEYRHYVMDLTAALAHLHRYEEPASEWRSRLLHVEQAPAVIDDLVLSAQVQAAKQNGLAVVVTEHLVRDETESWEQPADVLVTITTTAAARLRQRWPHKRVEFIPPGCPQWRPSRRDGTDRVIALVGLPSGDDALQELVQAVAAVPGARLLVFGTPPTVPVRGLVDSAGAVPIRFRPLPPSSANLVRQLGEEADAVLFWERAAMLDTSYAARVALASGVPVLTSPTSTHDDLGAAVLRSHNLAAELTALFSSRARREDLAKAAREFCQDAPWSRIATLHHALWETL